MFKSVDMILTDAPFVDTLIYNLKILALNCVIKNEEEALAAETKLSSTEASLYIKCCNGIATFEDFSYFPREIIEMTGLPSDIVTDCANNKNNIPDDYRDSIVANMVDYYIENYVERNNYYRMLQGLPDLGDSGIDVEEEWLPEGITCKPDTKLHELEQEVLISMDNSGVLAEIYEMYPKARYIDHMGAFSVDPATARQAKNFDILYVTTIDNSQIRNKFISVYNRNREYTLRRVYSDAYKFQSDYYDSFITVYILIMTMIDMMDNISEFIINKEIFDSRCIRHMFESYGLPYYSEIPVKYQLKILKNINTLIKYKSTGKNMQDICAIFGYDNIQIFKFYLLKHRMLDKDGNYVFATKDVTDPETGEVTQVEDPTKEYELKFVKVPLGDQPDEYIKQMEDHISYDVVTLSDYYWDGGEDHEAIKNEHLEADFGYKRVKYISIDTITDNAEIAFGMPYFLSMLYDTVKLEENLLMYIPYLNRAHYFRLTDVFCYLFAMTHLYMGAEDTIYIPQYVRLDENLEYYVEDVKPKIYHDELNDTYTISNMDEISNYNEYVAAFNFRPDIDYLNQYFEENHVTKKDLGIIDFQTPVNNIVRYENLLQVFTTNKGVYEHVVEKLRTAVNKREYDIYKTIYNHMMINEFTLDYFILEDGTFPDTYTEYLRHRDTILYLSLKEISSIEDIETRRIEIDTIVGNVLYAMDDYIDTDEYKFLFSYMPTVSADFIKKYIIKIIDIFRSYKIQLYDVNNLYNFTSKTDGNYIHIIEQMRDIWLRTKYTEYVNIDDDMTIDVNTTLKEKIGIGESVLITLYREGE